ncbi:MAG: translocation/assembly module TamB domain-containing protein [Sandaracinaceae bacterium]|nr:translocation/assembly module TamB domain-containing protein [Sandaracinaceae bacterium]
MPQKKRRHARAWLRFRRWAVILAIFALGIPVAAAAAVRSSNAHERLRSLAVQAIHDQLGLRATLGRVHLEIVPLSIVASDIALDDPVYGRLADARTIRVSPSVGSLLHGRVEISAIELDHASVHLVVRDDGVRNLPHLDTGDDDGGPPTLPFRRLVVRDSTVTIDGEPQLTGELRGVDVEVRGEEGHVIAVEASVSGGEVQRAGVHHELERLAALVRVSPDHVEVERADLAIGPLELTAEGAIVPLPPPADLDSLDGIRGHVHLGYDLANLAALSLPFTLPRMVGQATIDLTVAPGDDGVNAAAGYVELDEGAIEQFGLGDHVHLDVNATRERVIVTNGLVDVRGGGGHVGIEASLGFGPDLPLVAVARPDDLSFAHLMDQFEVSDSSLVEWIFDGELHLEGSLADVQHLNLEGPIDLHTRDFVVTKDGYEARPMRAVIAIPRGRFTGRWSIRDDAVRFENLVGDLPHSRIFGDVHLGFHNALRVEARADANLADVSPLDGFPMAGVGDAICHIDGTFQDPRVTGHLRLAGFEFDDFRLGDIESDAVLDRDGQGVTFPHIAAVKRDSRYAADDVYLDFHDGRFAMRGQLAFDRMTLGDFYHVFHFESDDRFLPYQGVLRGNASIAYTNGYPGDSPSGTLLTELDLGIQTATLNGYGFERGLFRGRWSWYDWSRSYRGGVLEIEHAELRKGEGVVTLAGSMQREGVLSMTVNADRLALRDLEGIGDRMGDLDGVAGVSARVSGSADRMIVDADVGIYDVVYAGRSLGDGRAYARMTYDDDPWVLAARDWPGNDVPPDEPCGHGRAGLAHASWPEDPPIHTVDGPMRAMERPSAFVVCGSLLDGDVDFDLAVGRQSSYPLRGKIHLNDVDLSRFLPSVDDELVAHASTQGVVRAMLRFDDGGFREPASLRGEVRVNTLAVERGELRLENARPIVVRFDRGVAQIESARLRGPGVRARMEGEASLESGLGLEVFAAVDLSTLPRVTTAVREAEGSLALRLAVTGPFAAPEYYGEARLEGGVVRLASFEGPITELAGHATFSARRILVEEISARLAGGNVRLAGEAMLDEEGLARYAFQIRARELSLTPSDGLEVTLGADTELAWGRGQRLPSLGGEVRVARLEYAHNIELGTTLGELSRTQRTEVDRYDPEHDWISLDVRIRHDHPFVVRNNLIDAELRIEDSERPFRLTGTNQRYGAVGDMRFARGRVFFRNASFELRPGGSLTFDDEERISARFDVHASTDIRRSGDLSQQSWRVLLDATGTTDSFSIATRSDPDLPQEDILLLLAVGLTRSELETLRGGDLTSTLALEALASVTGIDREVRRAVPVIDDFRLSSAYSVRTGRTEPQVSIGKRIADRVRLSATTGLSEAREFRAVLEAQLDDTTSIQAGYDNYNLTSASSFGNVGVDLRWRLEFQ